MGIEDCVCCTFSIGLAVSFLIAPVLRSCPHTRTKTKRSTFKSSKPCLAASSLLLMLALGCCYFYVQVLIDTCSTDKQFCLILATDALYVINAFLWMAFSIAHTKFRVRDLNGWSWIVARRTSYGIPTVLDVKHQDGILKIFYRNFGLGFAVMLGIFLYFQYVLDDQLEYKYARFVLMLLSVFSQNNAMTFMAAQGIYLVGIYETMKKEIKAALENGQIAKLQKLSRFAIVVRWNSGLMQAFYEPTLLFSLCLTMGVLIASLCVNYFCWSEKYVSFLVFILARTAYTMCVVVQVFLIIDSPKRVYEEIVSIIFKNPISKLQRAESYQVEMLLQTLIMTKPVYTSIGGICVWELAMLASISSTVLTYVLVALQFHIHTS